MPFFGELEAPTFDSGKPNQLRRFFMRLDALFTCCGVSDDLDKKKYTIMYPEADVAELWEALPQFVDPLSTFEDLRDALLGFYTIQYTTPDLDQLVEKYRHSGIHLLQDLTQFHLKFNEIASKLIDLGLISLQEQSMSYLQTFENEVQAKISFRLQVAHPDHHPSLPYSINILFNVAQWILRGSAVSMHPPHMSSPILSPSPSIRYNLPTLSTFTPSTKTIDRFQPIQEIPIVTIPSVSIVLPPSTIIIPPSPIAIVPSLPTPTSLPYSPSEQDRINALEEEIARLKQTRQPPRSQPRNSEPISYPQSRIYAPPSEPVFGACPKAPLKTRKMPVSPSLLSSSHILLLSSHSLLPPPPSVFNSQVVKGVSLATIGSPLHLVSQIMLNPCVQNFDIFPQLLFDSALVSILFYFSLIYIVVSISLEVLSCGLSFLDHG